MGITKQMSQIQWIKECGTKKDFTGRLFKLAVLAELPEHDMEYPDEQSLL